MKSYYRFMLGKGSMYAEEGFKGNFVGVEKGAGRDMSDSTQLDRTSAPKRQRLRLIWQMAYSSGLSKVYERAISFCAQMALVNTAWVKSYPATRITQTIYSRTKGK